MIHSTLFRSMTHKYILIWKCILITKEKKARESEVLILQLEQALMLANCCHKYSSRVTYQGQGPPHALEEEKPLNVMAPGNKLLLMVTHLFSSSTWSEDHLLAFSFFHLQDGNHKSSCRVNRSLSWSPVQTSRNTLRGHSPILGNLWV